MAKLDREDGSENLFRPGALFVRLLLALEDWSQARLAAAAGCDQWLISHLARGKRDPEPGMLERLASAAGWPAPFVERLARAAIRARWLPVEPPDDDDLRDVAEAIGR